VTFTDTMEIVTDLFFAIVTYKRNKFSKKERFREETLFLVSVVD